MKRGMNFKLHCLWRSFSFVPSNELQLKNHFDLENIELAEKRMRQCVVVLQCAITAALFCHIIY